LVFHQVHPMNMYFHRRGHVFCCPKNLKSIVRFYAFLLIIFLKLYFRHLIPLIYRTQKDIDIVSKLFLNYFINLKRHHFICWHSIIHYNYNNVRYKKNQKLSFAVLF
jgi:hypothetical protein